MAIPERRDPNVPRADAGGLDTRGRRVRTGGGWGWWWIWLIIIGLVIWWAGWGWGTSGGYWRGNRNATVPRATANNTGGINGAAPNAGANTGTGYGTAITPAANAGNTAANTTTNAGIGAMNGPGVKVLDASNKQQYVGKPFQAINVPVQEKVNDHAVWIGTNSGQEMLAVVNNHRRNGADINRTAMNAGKTVDVSGTVVKAPSAQQAQREFGLTSGGASRLEKQGAYIELSQLTTPQQP